MKQIVSILKVIIFIFPIFVLAQSGGGSVPTEEIPSYKETPVSTPAQAGATSVPAATSAARTQNPLPSPTPTAQPPTAPTNSVLPSISSTTFPETESTESSSPWVLFLTISAGAVSLGALATLKLKRGNKDGNKCDSIKELLEQKKKELEEMIRNYPEEKLKSMAKDAVLGELKKDEGAKKVIETAEGLKAKHDKLKKTIEMLEKKYNLCMFELPSGGSQIRLSYLMGADSIQDKELEDLGIKIENKGDGDFRMLKISEKGLVKYKELIRSRLANGFWNEIVGDKEIIFIFKFKDGSTKEYNLSPSNESEIDKLCAQFNDESPDETHNVYKFISDNEFYHDFMVKHYDDMINRQRVDQG